MGKIFNIFSQMNRFAALIFFVLFIFTSLIAKATNNYIHIQADHVSYNKKLSTYYAYGHCKIYDVNYILKADKVSFNEKSSILVYKERSYVYTGKTDNLFWEE